MAELRAKALLFVEEDGQTREIELARTPFTIGRLVDRDLVLPEHHISRTHAQIVEESAQFFLVDQGSQSGSYVNGWRVQRQLLHDGDLIQIGSLEGRKLRFKYVMKTSSTSIRSLLDQMHDSSGSESSLGKLGWFVEAARRLNDHGAVHEILTVLIETTLQLTRVERGYVFLCNAANQMEFVVGRNSRNEPLTDDETVSHSAIQQAIQSGSEFIVTDTLSAEADAPSMSIVAHSLRAIICIPLRRRNAALEPEGRSVLGVLYLDSRQNRGKLTQVDSNLLNTVATEAAVLVQNATLAQAEEAGRRYRAELRIAHDIQQGLMTVRMPTLSYAEVNAQSLPCKEIGGDFYDVIATTEALHVVVADVSGKGVSAALLGSTLQGLIHAQIRAGQPLAQIAALANQFICGKDVGKYATLVLLRLTPDGAVEYINCGHVAPLLHAATEVRTLPNGNLPVGLISSAVYNVDHLHVEPGERILIVTDGLTEAENTDGRCYGDDCLEALVQSGGGLPAILEQVRGFTGGVPFEDDCTLLEVRYTAAR